MNVAIYSCEFAMGRGVIVLEVCELVAWGGEKLQEWRRTIFALNKILGSPFIFLNTRLVVTPNGAKKELQTQH